MIVRSQCGDVENDEIYKQIGYGYQHLASSAVNRVTCGQQGDVDLLSIFLLRVALLDASVVIVVYRQYTYTLVMVHPHAY